MSTELKKQDTTVVPATQEAFRRPYYEIHTSKNEYTVDVYMPGVAKNDYNVSLHHNELLVEGRKSANLPKGARWAHREISMDSYKLLLQLNVEVESDKISAKSENGVLRILLPVAKQARPRSIKIQ